MAKENKDYNLEELLKKSPMEVTHDEMMFILENMDMGAILQAATDRQNKQFIDAVKPKDDQIN